MDVKKLEYGSDEHLTLIGAAKNLHALTGQDRADMLAFGRACIAAERERCAAICDDLQDWAATEPRHCAEDIRSGP